MKTILFIFLLFAFVQEVIYPVQISGLVGLTIQNLTVYVSVMVLIVTEFSSGRIFKLKIFGFSGIAVILIGTLLNFIYHRLSGSVDISLVEHARYAKTMAFDPIVLYVLAFLLVDNKRQGRQYLIMLTSVVGILNAASLLGNFLGIQVFDVHEHYVSKDRFAGIAGNPNKTAYVLCMLIPIQYYFYKTRESGSIKWLILALIALECLTILLSGSRGGLLALIFVFGATTFIYKDYRILFIAALAVPIGMVVLFQHSLYLQETIDRVEVLVSGDLNSASASRFDIWSAMLEDYIKDPMALITGTGFGTANLLGLGMRAHNLYIQVLVEFGILGFVFWLGIIWRTIANIRKVITPGDEYFRSMVLLSVLVILFAWLFTTLIGVLELVGFSMGIGLAYLLQLTVEPRASDKARSGEVLNNGIRYKRGYRTG